MHRLSFIHPAKIQEIADGNLSLGQRGKLLPNNKKPVVAAKLARLFSSRQGGYGNTLVIRTTGPMNMIVVFTSLKRPTI